MRDVRWEKSAKLMMENHEIESSQSIHIGVDNYGLLATTQAQSIVCGSAI